MNKQDFHASAILLSSSDNVATLLDPVEVDACVMLTDASIVAAQQSAHRYFKICCQPIAAEEPVIKYGQVIGVATTDIAAGDIVHIHNMKSCRAVLD